MLIPACLPTLENILLYIIPGNLHEALARVQCGTSIEQLIMDTYLQSATTTMNNMCMLSFVEPNTFDKQRNISLSDCLGLSTGKRRLCFGNRVYRSFCHFLADRWSKLSRYYNFYHNYTLPQQFLVSNESLCRKVESSESRLILKFRARNVYHWFKQNFPSNNVTMKSLWFWIEMEHLMESDPCRRLLSTERLSLSIA